MNIKLTGFDTLISKLGRIIDIDKDIVNNVADKCVEIANSEYVTIKPNIGKENISENVSRVFSEASGLSFEEYGTGTRGQQTEHPNLPQSGVPITGNWQYNYPSNFKKLNKQGGIYWTYKKEDGTFVSSIGQKSGQQMYNTSIKIQKEIPTIVQNILKRKLEDV